jgi:hypothetical protein
MPRKIGSKNKTKNVNKNVNTAKNKNVININVNSNTSTKKGRGRPRKINNNNTNKPGDNPPNSSSGYNSRPQHMPPPIIPIITPSRDASMTLLSQFLTSKMLNDSNRTINLPETTQLNYSRASVEPSHTFNTRESIIPRLPDTPLPNRRETIEEIKPIGPPPPPPPKPPPPPPQTKKNGPQINSDFSHLKGLDAVNAELKYLVSDEGKAEKARKKAEAAAKKESKKLEKEAGPQQQSTTDFLNMSFSPPKKDIVEMMTPQKEPTSTAITPYKERQSIVDFLLGGTPKKTPQQLKTENNVKRLKELKHDLSKPKQLFEYNDLKTELTQQPNPNKDIAKSIIGESIKRKAAAVKVKEIKMEEMGKQQKQREDASHRIQAFMKNKLTKQFKEAKKELRPLNAGQPLVVKQNTKELILKKNRDRGIKAQQAAAGKKRNAEQEKIINFAKFMMDQNGVKPYSGLKQTNL